VCACRLVTIKSLILFKGNKEGVEDGSHQDISSLSTQNPSDENRESDPGNHTSGSQNTVLNLANQKANPMSVDSTTNSSNAANPAHQNPQPSKLVDPTSVKVEHQISGLISKEKSEKDEDYTDIKYGKDASVVITEQSMKSKNSVGRYSSKSGVTPLATEFGTVIGGVRVNGQSKFDVIKPSNNSQDEDSNLRSKLRKINKG
jgi:hypothetical protein